MSPDSSLLEPKSAQIRMCSWCNAIKVHGAYRRCPAIPKQDRATDNVTHGICPSCLADLQADVGRMLD